MWNLSVRLFNDQTRSQIHVCASHPPPPERIISEFFCLVRQSNPYHGPRRGTYSTYSVHASQWSGRSIRTLLPIVSSFRPGRAPRQGLLGTCSRSTRACELLDVGDGLSLDCSEGQDVATSPSLRHAAPTVRCPDFLGRSNCFSSRDYASKPMRTTWINYHPSSISKSVVVMYMIDD